jgi:O-methyltransferase
MIKGGVIILDDFGHQDFEEQYIAHTNWAKEKGIEILSMPTGQGVIIK